MVAFLIIGGITALILAAKDGNSTGTQEDASSRYETPLEQRVREQAVHKTLQATFPTKSGHSF